jgi:transposase
MNKQTEMDFWTKALRLPEFKVVNEQRGTPDDPVRFTVVPAQAHAVCPHCTARCDEVHRRHDTKPIKDLPLGDQRVELIVRTFQYHCPNCGAFFTPKYAAIAPGAHATQRFLAHAARLIDFSDIQNVASLLGVPENTMIRWYYDYVERQQQESAANLKPVLCSGIDELSLKKSTDSLPPRSLITPTNASSPC